MSTDIKKWEKRLQRERLARKEAEQLLEDMSSKLYERNLKLQEAKSIAKLGSWYLDIESHSLTWDDEAYNIFEIDKKEYAELSIKDFLNLIYQDDALPFFEAYNDKHLENHEPYSFIHRIITRNDHIKFVEERGVTAYDADNHPIYSHGTVQDITEQILLEHKMLKNEQVLESQSKMAEMGAMIGNIAHQWRQPLNTISILSSQVLYQIELDMLDEKSLKKSMENIELEVKYLSENIDTFRNFLKENKEVTENIIEERIALALKITDVALKDNHIDLINNIDYEKQTKIVMPTGELAEVIINIVNNAKDALVEKKIEEPWIKIDLSSIDQSVLITIEDNAGGIPEKILPEIFKQYFTTKDEHSGTGLGLHMSKKIVEESLNGKINAKNSANGAKFSIEIPINS